MTISSTPRTFSFLTVSGVAATRVSCGRRSLKIAIFMEFWCWERLPGQCGGTLHSAAFFAKADFRRVQQANLPTRQARHTAAMSERPVIITGFHFTKSTLATLAERYAI